MNFNRSKSKVDTYHKLEKLPLGAVTAKGWLREQLLRSKAGMGGHLDELEPEMIANPFISYSAFRIHPVLGEVDRTFAAGWSGEISGTYWTGLVQLAFTLGDEELIAKAGAWVEGVLRHQEKDGYLGSYPTETDRKADYNAWSATWCYRALLSWYEATGQQDVLQAVYKGLLWFCENWKDHKTDYGGSAILEPMVIVHTLTGDERLRTFCEDYLAWLEEHSVWQNKVSQYQSDRLPYGSMHAVAYGEQLKNPALLYCASGDRRMLEASVHGLKKTVRRIVQPTGGPSSCAEFLSPIGGANETEYCNFATYHNTYAWIAMITGDPLWGDEMERCVFNGAQGARKKDERAITYFSSPNQLHATRESCLYGDWGEYGVYAPCYHVACCPTQSVRIIPEFVRSMVLIDEQDDLYLLCYGPCTIKSPKLDLEMDTLYPFRESITLSVTRGTEGCLRIRIPAWCKKASVTVNGKETRLLEQESGFAKIDALVSTGDCVEIVFSMEISVRKVDDSASASKYPICIERGPLVYALPVPAKWTQYEGRPITPLPKDWCWYEAVPDTDGMSGDTFARNFNASWMKAVDEALHPNRIRVVEHEPCGYVWEHPPVTLEVPLYHAKYAYMFLSPRQNEPWEVPLETDGEEQLCTMVPHGCTNLRITCLPRAAKREE